MNEFIEVLEIAGLVLVVIYLLSHASKKKGDCGCSAKAVDDVAVNGGPCS